MPTGVGLAFQIRDDILDVIGDAEKLGKATGMDEHKNTFVRLYGVDRCQKMVEEETDRAVAALSVFPTPEFLRDLRPLAGPTRSLNFLCRTTPCGICFRVVYEYYLVYTFIVWYTTKD